MLKRTAIISDIHGCLIEFDEMLKLLDYKSSNVRVILAGDLIDRGEHSVGVVRRARELNLESVMGNHDHKLLKWLNAKGSRSDTYDRKPHYTQFNDDDINYIFHMPTSIKLEDALVVHAGLKPGVFISAQSDHDLMYIRYIDDDKKIVSLKKIHKYGKKETGARFWTDFGSFGTNVIYGHNVNSMTDIRIDRYDDGTACYGLDTGCCFGGRLTAMIWETKEIIQVQAKKTYYQPGFNI